MAGTFGLEGDSSNVPEWNQVRDEFKSLESKYTVNQVKADGDYLVHLREENCPRYKQIIDSA